MQIDFEKFLTEHERVHGRGALPPTALPPTPKKLRRPRARRAIQVDLEELIAEHKAAEAARAGSEHPSASIAETPAAGRATGSTDAGQSAPATAQEQPAHDEPAEPVPANDGQRYEPSNADPTPSSLFLGFKTVHFQKEDAAPASMPSVLRAVQALHEPGNGSRRPPICYCGAPRLKDVDVHLREDGSGGRRAGVAGVWRCRNGEICPLCAPAATARRRAAYARVGDAAMEKGDTMVSVVLSVSHSREDKLADLMKAVKRASTGARAGGTWHRKIRAALGCLGVMVDHHVRHGERYGWHYHQHLTIFCHGKDEAAIKGAVAMLVERYVRLLLQQGYRADADRQHVKILKEHPEGEPYTYPADHNASDDDETMGIVAADHDEDESMSPMMLAERAASGDERAAALFMEFSAAIRKTRSVVVTPAIAAALEIERRAEEPPAYADETRLGSIPGSVWTKLIDQNLNATFLTRVESAGREHWPTVRWWALEVTGEAPEYSDDLAQKVAALLHAQRQLQDPIAKELAQNQIGILWAEWTTTHGAELVAATVDYVAAQQRHMRPDPAEIDFWVAVLVNSADKAERRRRASVPHDPAHVRRPAPRSCPNWVNSSVASP